MQWNFECFSCLNQSRLELVFNRNIILYIIRSRLVEERGGEVEFTVFMKLPSNLGVFVQRLETVYFSCHEHSRTSTSVSE